MFATCFNIRALFWPTKLFFFIFWPLILKGLCIPVLNFDAFHFKTLFFILSDPLCTVNDDIFMIVFSALEMQIECIILLITCIYYSLSQIFFYSFTDWYACSVVEKKNVCLCLGSRYRRQKFFPIWKSVFLLSAIYANIHA